MATFLDSAKATIAVAASTWTVSTPTTAGALVEGDLLLFQFAYDTSSGTDVSNVTAPDGLFTVVAPASSVATNGTSWVQGAVYGKFVTAGEAASPPASWSFGLSQTLEGSVVCARFRGVDPFDPIAVSDPTAGYSLYTGSATTVTKTVPSVTTDADNALVVGGMMHRSGAHTLSIDTSGWTVAGNTGGEGGRGTIMGVRNAVQTPPGSTGTVTFRSSTGAVSVAYQTALNDKITGTGAAAAPAPALAGTGSLRLTGASAAAAAAAIAVGAGLVSLTGTGGMTAPAATVAGAGQVAVLGNGSATASPATATASGSLRLTGTSAPTAPAPVVSGAGAVTGAITGNGSAVAGTPTVAGAGTLATTGAGAATAPAPTLTGAGSVGSLIAGTGTLAPQPPTLTGTGTLTLTGSGSAVAGSPTVAATVAVVIVGTGDATAPGAIVVGSGSVFDPTAFRDITVTVGPLTGHPLRITGLTTHPLRATQLATHPLTVTALEV